MAFRPKAADYPEGSAMHKQLLSEEKRSADLEVAAANPSAITGFAKMQRPEQSLQMEMINTAKTWPMAVLLGIQRHEWPGDVWRTPLIDWLFHVPNGGARTAIEAKIFMAMGVKPGVWDLFLMLPVLRDGRFSAGLWIENKAGAGKLTEYQEAFGRRALLVGYECSEARSVFDFTNAVENYLKGAQHYAASRG